MTNGFNVEPDALHQHSGSVRELAERVGNAAQAAHHLASLDDAYGLICQGLGLPDLLRQPQEDAAAAMDNVQNLLQRTSTKLGQGADDYQRTEDEHRDRLARVRTDLDAVGQPSAPSGSPSGPNRTGEGAV